MVSDIDGVTEILRPFRQTLFNLQAKQRRMKGEHDFKSFCNVHTQVEDTVRTIYDLEVEKEEELITIRVRGNGFLYNMVRILAGTLIGVGRGAIAPEQIPAILEAKDRQAAGMTVPPQGLTLVKIDYLDEKSK